MKTEIKISVPKTVRFDGWHCLYDCEVLNNDIVCELFEREIQSNNFKFDRLQACVRQFGVGDEK